MSTWQIVLLVTLLVLIAALVVLYFVGKRMQKKQAEQQEQLEAAKQQVSMLIIDKKMLPVKDSGLPQMVIDQVPRMMRGRKLPIVQVKVGPRVMRMIADEKIFDDLPVKKEVKATVSGIYITEVKGLHGRTEVKPKKKPGIRARLLAARDKATNNLNEAEGRKKK